MAGAFGLFLLLAVGKEVLQDLVIVRGDDVTLLDVSLDGLGFRQELVALGLVAALDLLEL